MSPAPAPIYDQVFAEGVKALDEDGGGDFMSVIEEARRMIAQRGIEIDARALAADTTRADPQPRRGRRRIPLMRDAATIFLREERTLAAKERRATAGSLPDDEYVARDQAQDDLIASVLEFLADFLAGSVSALDLLTAREFDLLDEIVGLRIKSLGPARALMLAADAFRE